MLVPNARPQKKVNLKRKDIVMKVILSVLILLFSTSIAFSEEPADDLNINCQNPLSQAEMNICANKSQLSAQENLNSAYEAALKSMKNFDSIVGSTEETTKDNAVTLLKKSQDLWVQYLEATCDAEGFLFQGGTMQPQVVDDCLERMTNERANYLKDIFSAY